MSDDALPPVTASLADRLEAAMAKSPKYKSQRALAAALQTDGSVVGKWLSGKTKRIESRAHLAALPKLLKTPAGYFSDGPRQDLLVELEGEVGALGDSVAILLATSALLAEQVVALGGEVPSGTLDALRQAVAGRPL